MTADRTVREDARLVTWPAPEGAVLDEGFTLRVNGQPVSVYGTQVAAFAIFDFTGVVEVEIENDRPFEQVKVRPLSRGVQAAVDGRTVRFALDRPGYFSVEFDGHLRRPLLLWSCAPESEPAPSADDPNVLYFGPGVHEVEGEEIRLQTGQTLYLAGGAVVHGRVFAEDAQTIAIRGRGVLDGLPWCGQRGRHMRLMRFANCQGLRIDGPAFVNSPTWTCVPMGSRDIDIRNAKIITWTGGGDGFDIVGCQDVLVENCFARTKDDCVAIKATGYSSPVGCQDVRNVVVRGCVFWNAEWGNAIEIGYETRCEEMSGIVFEDLDIIHCEAELYSSGATFSIHNGDRALVRDVIVRNIRVEDSHEKLIDIKVLFAQYSKDEQRGRIRGVLLKDIHVVDGPIPVSIIQGYDGQHMVEDVTIEGLRFHGQPVETLLDARMVHERAHNVRFVRPDGSVGWARKL